MDKNLLIEDESSSFNAKAQNRAIDCARVAKLARKAAEKATAANDIALAAKLTAEAEDLENAAQN